MILNCTLIGHVGRLRVNMLTELLWASLGPKGREELLGTYKSLQKAVLVTERTVSSGIL